MSTPDGEPIAAVNELATVADAVAALDDRGPDPANPTKARAVRRDSKAYVLRQMAPDGPWFVVDRSGPSRLTVPVARPMVDGRDPMEAMVESAELRQRYTERITTEDDHVVFVAVTAAELAEFQVRT